MADIEVLHRRLREMRSRVLILSWEYRQRRHAKGALPRVLRQLALAKAAYALSEEDAQALIDAGVEPLPVGQDLQPRMTLFRVNDDLLHSLPSRKPLPMHWKAPLLGTPYLALVPFQTTSTEELLQLAEEDTTMEAAKNALEDLAQDPEARRLADKREIDRKLYQYELAETARRAAADAEAGRQQAEAETQRAEAETQRAEAETQRAEAETRQAQASLRRVTRLMLESRFGKLPDWADQQLATASTMRLEAICEAAGSPGVSTVEAALAVETGGQ